MKKEKSLRKVVLNIKNNLNYEYRKHTSMARR